VTVRFLNNEIRSDSIEVLVHNKVCGTNNKCIINMMNKNFTSEIKDKILASARQMKITEVKKENK
jgi:hypothetical protein